jgi:hypothetical protein
MVMKHWLSKMTVFCVMVGLLLALSLPRFVQAQSDSAGLFRRLPVQTYRQKMAAAWVGQMFGVSYGAPTEFRYLARMIPEGDVPPLYPGLVNEAFNQDDLYVEMTFLKTLETYGLDVSAAQAGIDFANSEYQLWFANLAARDNLRAGIAPPDSGHPAFSGYSDDIDFQIESDFAGLISPGLPNSAIALGEKFGGIMNYGDGLYAGQFIACLYAESFFESDPLTLVQAGLSCIPAASQYAEAVRDVIAWWQDSPDDWEATWTQINDKYTRNLAYRLYSSSEEAGTRREFNIDAKVNGAYVVMGLLYGGGDPLRTLTIAMRGGQDSDCNTASVAGVLAAIMGYDALPAIYTAALDTNQEFSYTDYRFPDLLVVSEQLAREAIVAAGGSIETDANGEDVFLIPIQTAQPSPFVQSWAPGYTAGTSYTPEQMALIHFDAPRTFARDVAQFAPGWAAVDCRESDLFGLYPELLGRPDVLLTQSQRTTAPCRLITRLHVPTGSSTLAVTVGHYPQGNWRLVAKVDGVVIGETVISADTAPENWLDVQFDLSPYAGQDVNLELLNQGEGKMWENGYWASIEVRAAS